MLASTHKQGFSSVLFAIMGNGMITIIKLIGFLLSGSSALFSETIHSLADTMNQSLLMIGIKRSTKRADDEFTYGYGQERFLWALISAVGIFFLGAGVTTFHGINVLLESGHVPVIEPVIFLILLISFVVEGFTFLIAIKELRKSNPRVKLSEMLRKGDPTTIAVIYEDGAALLGVIVAFLSIFLVRLTGNQIWDAIGSIAIGILLGVVAIILINKNRSFLMKKAIPEEMREQIMGILEADPVVEKVLDFKSTVLDIGCYHIKCDIEFNGSALLTTLASGNSLKDGYDDINDDFEEFKKFFVRYIDRVPRVVGAKINELEAKIRQEVPGVEYIDIEIN